MSLNDYEAYLDDDFQPVEFANGLVSSTNNADDDTLDLATSLKRLNFDLKDIDKRTKASVGANYQSLIAEFENLDKFEAAVKSLNPAVDQLNNSYKKLDDDILQPYNECNQIHSALKKIHQTATLLRSSIFFLFLLGKIEEVDKQNLSQRPLRSLLQLSRLLSELRVHLQDSAYLKSLKLVRDYEPFQQRLTNECIDTAADTVRKLNANDDEQTMLNAVYSLLYLSPGTFYNRLQQLSSSATSRAVGLISRNLNNVRNLDNVFKEIDAMGLTFSRLDKVLQGNKFIDTAGHPAEDGKTVWDEVKQTLDMNTGLTTSFWRDVATGIEPKFKEIVSKGGPIARNLRDSKNLIRDVMRQAVQHSLEDDDTDDRLAETLMINATRVLDRH